MYFKPGEKGLERRRELEEIFTEQECGGLECRTCGYALSAAMLLDGMEKTGGVGALGIMSSHKGGGEEGGEEEEKENEEEEGEDEGEGRAGPSRGKRGRMGRRRVRPASGANNDSQTKQ